MGAAGPAVAFFLVLGAIGVWKLGEYLCDKVSKPAGYALIAATAAGVLVVLVADAETPEQGRELRIEAQRALRDLPAASADGAVEVSPAEQQRQLKAVKKRLEDADIVTTEVRADRLQRAVSSEDTADEAALAEERRSIWEMGTDERGRVGTLTIPYEPRRGLKSAVDR